MTICQYALNTDISGIGVRVSYYLQTLFLGCLSARSGSLNEITGALYTLMATNAAMAVTGLILGLKLEPEISLQDAVIIIYLLSMSWITVIFSLASCNRLSGDTTILQLVSVLQSYVIMAFAFVVVGQPTSFGQSPNCNQNAVAVIFPPFPASKSGRIVGGTIVGLVVIGYTAMTVIDYTAQVRKKIGNRKLQPLGPLPESKTPASPESNGFTMPAGLSDQTTRPFQRRSTIHAPRSRALINYRLLFMLFCIVISWAFFVLNTELAIHWNQPTQADAGPSWQFGQILPMFLAFLPFINMINAFNEFGFKPIKQVDARRLNRPTMVSIEWDTGFDAQQNRHP
ncbi:hypothetical protein FB451DRAFT_1572945 [Mycena latifolia]|nr:hypothetical protein FB451DRAFT_1572945 [Mycena latifolia]